MSNKQQISLSLAYVAMIVILQTIQVKSKQADNKINTVTDKSVSDTPMPEWEAESRTILKPKDSTFKKNADGVISDSRLENFLNDMIATTKGVLKKASMVGRDDITLKCIDGYNASLDNLNKALALYHKGVKEEGLKELTALIDEAKKNFRRCEKLFTDQEKPSPFSVYDTWLDNLAKNFEAQSEADVKKA